MEINRFKKFFKGLVGLSDSTKEIISEEFTKAETIVDPENEKKRLEDRKKLIEKIKKSSQKTSTGDNFKGRDRERNMAEDLYEDFLIRRKEELEKKYNELSIRGNGVSLEKFLKRQYELEKNRRRKEDNDRIIELTRTR